MHRLPWNERVNMLSINPDAATRDDVARMAAELAAAKLASTNEQSGPPTKWRSGHIPAIGTVRACTNCGAMYMDSIRRPGEW